jgi:general secretion pathway protein G
MNSYLLIRNTDDGWTFIETVIVIAIILVLSSSVGVITVRHIDSARVAAARSQIDSFSIALESYYIDCGRYPSTEQGLSALWEKPVVAPISASWRGPYILKRIPDDPWGNPYVYAVPGPYNLPYIIKSFGSDGREGGENNDADVVSTSN